MIRDKNGTKTARTFCGRDGEDDEDWVFSNWRESTAKGMFSWSGLHLDSWGGCELYIMARNTAETVGMYAVLLRARSHVSPISWQSLLNILLALLSSCSAVPFLLPPFSCNNFIEHMKGHFGPRNKFVTNWSNCVQCKSAKCTWRRRFLRSIA